MTSKYIDWKKAGNRQIWARKNCFITGEVFAYDTDTQMYYICVQGKKEVAKEVIFNIAKIAGNSIFSVSNYTITLSFRVTWEHNREEKRQKMTLIQDYLRNCQHSSFS